MNLLFVHSHFPAVSAKDSIHFRIWQTDNIHHLLNVLFSNKLGLKEKTTILEEIYGMKMTKNGLSKENTVLEVQEQFSKDFLYAKDMVELYW